MTALGLAALALSLLGVVVLLARVRGQAAELRALRAEEEALGVLEVLRRLVVPSPATHVNGSVEAGPTVSEHTQGV